MLENEVFLIGGKLGDISAHELVIFFLQGQVLLMLVVSKNFITDLTDRSSQRDLGKGLLLPLLYLVFNMFREN